jgi:hypothetical protein
MIRGFDQQRNAVLSQTIRQFSSTGKGIQLPPSELHHKACAAVQKHASAGEGSDVAPSRVGVGGNILPETDRTGKPSQQMRIIHSRREAMRTPFSRRTTRAILVFRMAGVFALASVPAEGQFFTQASDTPQIIASATGESPSRPIGRSCTSRWWRGTPRGRVR